MPTGIYPRIPAIERFEKGYIPEPNTGCWIWLGGISTAGYGLLSFGAAHHGYAHRFSYLTFKGNIPEGLEIDHLCRIRSCCNPQHLEAVDRRTNIMRGIGPETLAEKQRNLKICKQGHSLADAYLSTAFIRGKIRTWRRCKRCSAISCRKYRHSKICKDDHEERTERRRRIG